jgi:hypothetical protein
MTSSLAFRPFPFIAVIVLHRVTLCHVYGFDAVMGLGCLDLPLPYS